MLVGGARRPRAWLQIQRQHTRPGGHRQSKNTRVFGHSGHAAIAGHHSKTQIDPLAKRHSVRRPTHALVFESGKRMRTA